MNTDIRTLQLLERDLEQVAARERELLMPVDRSPARLPGRGRGAGRLWVKIAAAVVGVLLLAGGIGFLLPKEASQDIAGKVDRAPQPTTAPTPIGDSVPFGREGSGAGSTSLDGRDATRAELNAPGAAVDASADESEFAPASPKGDLSKIVRDGRIGIVIADGSFSKGVARVTRIATANGGFVLSSRSRDERSGTLTLRIPAKRFDEAMLSIRALATDLEGEVELQAITGEDVTADYIDLKARLGILQDRQALLRGLQREATTSTEILRLARDIEQTQLEIEQIQGQLRFLNDQVNEATIEVAVRERDVTPAEPVSDPANPSLDNSLELAVQGFLRVVGAVVIGLGYLIPIAMIGLLVWVAVRLVRRRDPGAD